MESVNEGAGAGGRAVSSSSSSSGVGIVIDLTLNDTPEKNQPPLPNASASNSSSSSSSSSAAAAAASQHTHAHHRPSTSSHHHHHNHHHHRMGQGINVNLDCLLTYGGAARAYIANVLFVSFQPVSSDGQEGSALVKPNTPCQHTPSAHPIIPSYQHILLKHSVTHPFDSPSQPTPSTHRLTHPPCQHSWTDCCGRFRRLPRSRPSQTHPRGLSRVLRSCDA